MLTYPRSTIMPRIHHFLPALIAATAHSGELTLEMKPFFIAHSLDAMALPDATSPILLDAEAWSAFEIVSIADHGSVVKKGDALVIFETEAIDRRLADTKQAIATATLNLAQAELDLATLEKAVPEQLARLERAAAMAAEELDHFTKTARKSAEESAGFDLKRREQVLASYKEELKQLLKMYEADDITEETEEIILQDQKDSVEAAEFALRMEMLNHKRTLETSLPRQLIALTEKRDDTALSLDKGAKDLPRSVELKKLEIAALKTSLERDGKALAELEKGRALFEIKAPADGLFYYGAIEDGKWITGDLIKTLEPGGLAPVGKTFATFIPATAKPLLHTFPDQATARVLAEGAEGIAVVPGREDIAIPVSLKTITATPSSDLTHPATFNATWPENLSTVPGQSLQIRIVSHNNEQAITVPTKALGFGPKGWTVEVKLADGKTEARSVTRGRSDAENTEITAGLEAGQVVIVP
jgi:multidrug efflux pump subunit AcrA (membrane-fusion protein)